MSETDLRWRLRQLPREREPANDLWPGIAERLGAGSHWAAPMRRWRNLAIAASVLVAIGLAWQLRPVTTVPPSDPAARFAIMQGDAMTREYMAALAQLRDAPMPAPLQPTLDTLDRSALDIRNAIAASPQSVFLLQRLQRTYSRRLTLTQRAITG